MKLERLQKTLDAQSTSKIFVVTELFCLCGNASAPQFTEAGLRVRIAASVRVVLGSLELIEEPVDSGTLTITDRHKVTRRLQTHRRHVEGRSIPAEYFRLAKEL